MRIYTNYYLALYYKMKTTKQYKLIRRDKVADIFFGKLNERIVFDYIKELHPDCEVFYWSNPYQPMDFLVRKKGVIIHEYEVKSRRNIYFGQHVSLFFGANKLKYADRQRAKFPKRKHTFLWYLADQKELYCWDYDGTQKEGYEYYRADGWNGNEKKKPCIYIWNKFIDQLVME